MPFMTKEDSDAVQVAATNSTCRHLATFTRFLAEEPEEITDYPAIEARAVARCTCDQPCRYQRWLRPGELYSFEISCCIAQEAVAHDETHTVWTQRFDITWPSFPPNQPQPLLNNDELQIEVATRMLTEARISALRQARTYAAYQRVIAALVHELGRSGENTPMSRIPIWNVSNGVLVIHNDNQQPVITTKLRAFIEHHVPFISQAEQLGLQQTSLFD